MLSSVVRMLVVIIANENYLFYLIEKDRPQHFSRSSSGTKGSCRILSNKEVSVGIFVRISADIHQRTKVSGRTKLYCNDPSRTPFSRQISSRKDSLCLGNQQQ
jgi:hypothetical protein